MQRVNMSSAVITRMFRWNRQKERGLKGEDRKKAGEQKEREHKGEDR